MYTKAEYLRLHDPDMALYWGIEEDITQLQIKAVGEISYNPPLVVLKKVYDELRTPPLDFTVTTNDVGIPVTHRGITKISWL